MSMHYIIDGYNVLWATHRFGGGELRRQREKLLQFLESERPTGSVRNRVTVVFDGQDDVESPPWVGTVHVIFSRTKDADALIKRLVDNEANPRTVIVVTNDREIKKWVQAAHARTLSSDEFLAAAATPKPKRAQKMSEAEAQEINDELKQIWKLK